MRAYNNCVCFFPQATGYLVEVSLPFYPSRLLFSDFVDVSLSMGWDVYSSYPLKGTSLLHPPHTILAYPDSLIFSSLCPGSARAPHPPALTLCLNETPRNQDVLDIVPRLMIQPGIVLREGVVSTMDQRNAPDVLLLTAAEKHADYSLLAFAASMAGRDHIGMARGIAGGGTESAEAARVVAQKGLRHRREWKEVDELGFRRFIFLFLHGYMFIEHVVYTRALLSQPPDNMHDPNIFNKIASPLSLTDQRSDCGV